jgi:endonuclease III-like uncharacterized protein
MPQKEPSNKPAIDDPWEDLVISLLSVNQYSLEHTYRSLDGLREQGLFDPKNLVRWDQDQVADRLKSAGCNRGQFMTNLFALRLCNLGVLLETKGIDASTRIIASCDRKAIEDFLLPVNGIGPKVIANFCLLREI